MLNSRHDVRRVCLTLPFTLLGAFAMACAESPIAPTEDDFVTEIFSGVLRQQGQSTHLFEVTLQGRVDATILSLEPLTSITVGAQLGTWDGTSCTVLSEIEIRQGETLSRSFMPVGENCITLIDVGNVSEASPIAYELEVIHP